MASVTELIRAYNILSDRLVDLKQCPRGEEQRLVDHAKDAVLDSAGRLHEMVSHPIRKSKHAAAEIASARRLLVRAYGEVASVELREIG